MAYDTKVWRCGKYELALDRPRIMGILNVTPDSFSDGGEHFDADAAIAYGLAMLDAGADIIDVGGESTRPGFTPVDPTVEAARVIPVVRALAAKGAIVSIDTRNVETAKAAVRVGASIVNDVTGFSDPKMVEFAAASTCGLIVMYSGDEPEPARSRTAVELDTSAAAYAAEKARAAEKGETVGGARRLQSQIPSAKAPNGSAAVAEPPAAEVPAPDAPAEQDQGDAAQKDSKPAAKLSASLPSADKLAALMAKKSERREPTVAAAQLRRFTLPDSAPIMRRVMGFLSDQARTLLRAGVERERICLDPGAGFGKSANEDVVIQRETAKMASLGYPLLCAVSRKRFVGAISGVAEAPARDAATFGVCLAALEHGANIVRLHDVGGFAQFLRGYWAVAKAQPRRAFIALGSNMGDRMGNVREARDLVAALPLTCVSNCSHIYESEPAYDSDQAAFANAVIEIKTELAPTVLLRELLAIEERMGRVRERENGPRVIDCDLLWMENEIHGGDVLRLPHPLLGERDFVLVPLEDLVHDPARFLRFQGIDVRPAEERVGHVTRELGEL